LFVGVFCALLLTVSAFAADTAVKATNNTAVITVVDSPPPNAWVMTLGGAGATGTKADGLTAFGVNASLGRTLKLGLPAELGVRQGFGYVSDPSSVLLTTKPYLDFTLVSFFDKKLDIYAGANIGAAYGDMATRWTVAPEVGVDYWIAKNVAIDGRLEYALDINSSGKSQNVLGYFVGVKFKF